MKKKHAESFIIIRSFLITTIILGTIAATGCYYMYVMEAESVENVIKINEKMHNNLLSRTISLDLKSLFNDLELTGSHVEIKNFLNNRNLSTRSDLESEFIALCQVSKSYDQVRILDNTGMELVRVNYNNGHPQAVPSQELQDKSNRYYFKESQKLKQGEVYVSPFDLNIENGKIEEPLKPMIRVSMPIYDDSKQRLGIVILNYLGQQILDSIAANKSGDRELSMLLNDEGYWLLSPDKKQEWAFMYNDRKSLDFGTLNPHAWEIITSAKEGQFSTKKGLYTYSTIVVAPEAQSNELESDARQWKVVCVTPISTIETSYANIFNNYAIIYTYAFLLILFGGLTRARFIGARAQGQRRLEKAKLEAENANRAKSDFLARMSHEIRTPMNAVIGLTHLALKTELTSKQTDYLTKVDMSAKSLLGIINDILDFSKIEAGKLEVEEVDFILDDVLNDIVNMLGLQAEQKGIEFLLMVKSTVPNLLVGDRLRLGQVLLNLTGNALKFTESGEIIIAAKLIEETNDTAIIQFSVKDTGIGISPEQAAKLFQPFNQADGSISRQFGGTGLGLTISKRLVEMMGGKIELKSEIGEGSEFVFTIPFGLQAKHSGAHHVYPDEVRGMRVLAVDDSKMSRMVLDKVLRSFTFDVVTARNGGQALELLHKNDESSPFKLVITDWRMPDIDGIELVQKIKKTTLLKNIPKVIMLTAFGQDEIRHRAERVDLDGFMLKPFNRSILFDTIMETITANTPRRIKNSSESPRLGVPNNVAGAHVLLAEDNEINQQVAREILEGADITVSIANNGQEAVEMIKVNTYDAVLMDIQMPVMDGFKAVEKIRADKKLQSIPIIAMTAHALVGDKEKSLLAGMNDHVTKPIDPDILMEVLSKWLRNSPKVKKSTPCPPSTEETPLHVFENIPGIDAVQALARVRGNTVLLKRLLINFSYDCNESYSQLPALISMNKLDEAQHMVHSIKGVAGNVGANVLHQSALKMEIALRDDPKAIQDKLNALETERKRIEKGIFAAFPQQDRDKIAKNTDKKLLKEFKSITPYLTKLSSLLKKHDVEARGVYQSIEIELTHAAPLFAKELGDLLNRFDFKNGREKVENFMKEYKELEKNNK
nr:response regulator [uncultured Pseudodesulfovibrio sp.]